VDGEGQVWVSWEDASGVHLASSGEGSGFQQQDIGGAAEGGVTPSLAITEDGASAYLAWFDPVTGDLFVGVSAELSDVLLAAPSPTPPLETGPAPGECGQDAEILLEVTAPGLLFEPTCLVAPAGEAFTITFNNDDEDVSHNVAVLPEPGSAEPLAATELKPGPYTDELPVDPLEEGEYPFLCQAHPAQMTGILAVVGGGGGQGGGGQGGNGGQGGGGGNGGGGGGG
jgi:plastocyanin